MVKKMNIACTVVKYTTNGRFKLSGRKCIVKDGKVLKHVDKIEMEQRP